MREDSPSTEWVLRDAEAGDVHALAALYAAAVRALGPEAYTPVQVASWAAFAEEHDAFRRFVLDHESVVAEAGGYPAGFAGLSGAGRVTALYVHPDWQRRGLASALLQEVLDRAAARGLSRLFTEASAFSRPVFERFGFELAEVETVDRRGVAFERFKMVREVRPATDSPHRG